MKKYMHEQNRLWDYEILRELGRGEYGQVFEVKSKKDGQTYALKKINISGMHEKQKIQAFREVKALKLIHYPHIIEYFDSFLSMDNIYIVTEFAEKSDLSVEIRSRLRKQKKFTEDELWSIFESLVLGVKHLHDKNIIHRDLKAENIFQFADGKFKVGDLGMSKIIYETSELLSTRVGTPAYFAPEIIQHRLYSFPVDIWALGCVFYSMAALEHPYKDATIQTLGYYIIDKDPRPIKGAYSPQLIAFISSMFEKNPQARPTIHDIYRTLKQRKQKKISNKVSIYNLKKILSLKAQDLEVLPPPKKKSKQPKQEIVNSPNLLQSRNKKGASFSVRESAEKETIHGKSKDKTKSSLGQKRDISMALPKRYKISSSKSKGEGGSPFIKSNGFSLQSFELCPETQTSQTARYGLGKFSSASPVKVEKQATYFKRVRARAEIM